MQKPMSYICSFLCLLLLVPTMSTAADSRIGLRHILVRLTKSATYAEKLAARKRIDEIMERLKAGEDFRELAKKESDDEKTKGDGGNIGYFELKPGVNADGNILHALKPGERSNYFLDPDGVQVFERYTEQPSTLFDATQETAPTTSMSNHEFKLCASAYREDPWQLYLDAMEAHKSYEFAELDATPRVSKSQLMAKLAKLSENNEALSTCNQLIPKLEQILEYCPQTEYSSMWCSDYLKQPAIIEAKEKLEKFNFEEKKRKEQEDETFEKFLQCARIASDVEGQEKQYKFHLGLYSTGFSSISFSQMSAERQDMNNSIRKFNSQCSRRWLLNPTRAQELCAHPAYTSKWCSEF